MELTGSSAALIEIYRHLSFMLSAFKLYKPTRVKLAAASVDQHKIFKPQNDEWAEKNRPSAVHVTAATFRLLALIYQDSVPTFGLL
jgi:hypothetical protein